MLPDATWSYLVLPGATWSYLLMSNCFSRIKYERKCAERTVMSWWVQGLVDTGVWLDERAGWYVLILCLSVCLYLILRLSMCMKLRHYSHADSLSMCMPCMPCVYKPTSCT